VAVANQCDTTLRGDLNCDYEVTAIDFARLAEQWMRDNCVAPSWCAGADIDRSTVVDTIDLKELAENWLRASYTHWRVMPIRSQEEFNLGLIGGEAEQHPHSIARSLSDSNIVYLSHDVCQTWKSTNAGLTWNKSLGKGLFLTDGQSIEVDPIDPNIVFLIVAAGYNWLQTNLEGIYRSADGGDNWSIVLQTATHYDSSLHQIYSHNIAADPASATASGAARFYAAFPNNALFRSDNGGQSFNSVADLSGHAIIYGVQTHPSDGNTVYVASSNGLYASSSRGSGLAPLGNLPSGHVTSIQINPADANVIYATVESTGLYKSINTGTTFTLLRSFDAAYVFMNPGRPDTLYLVGVNANTITTHNGGATWITNMATHPAPGLGRDGSSWKSQIAGMLSGIVCNPTDANEAVAFSRATLWKTTDGGHNFYDSSTLFTGYSWGWWNYGVAFDSFNSDRFATFNMDVGMAITSTAGDFFDGRNSNAWNWYTQGLISWIGTYSGAFQPVPNSKIIVASIGGYFDTEIMRTTDEGLSWSLVTASPKQNLFIAFHPKDPNLVYAGEKISHDAGATFSDVNFGTYNAYNPSILGMCLAQGDTIYAMDSDLSRILRSDNRGNSWYLYTQPGWKFRLLDSLPTFAVSPNDPNKIYTLNSSYDLAVFDGISWRSTGVLALAGGISINNFVRSVAIDPRYPGIIYAGTFASGLPCIFRSTDDGHTWTDITYNHPNAGGSPLIVNPHTGELLRGGVFGTWLLPPPYPSPDAIYHKLRFPQ